MRVVLQRVKEAKVEIAGQVNGQIKQGLLLLVGFTDGDGQAEIDYLARKIVNARIFSDEADKLNLSLLDIGGEILSVSQFTLYAQVKKGNRPSFTEAQDPKLAQLNYEKFNQALASYGPKLATGVFGADMQVSLLNDGPVTIIYEA